MTTGGATPGPPGPVCPFEVNVDVIDGMLNVEIADDPHYTGLEVQTFADPAHGRGMLAFLTRRADGRADVYRQPGLRVDRRTYQIQRGVGRWDETAIDPARLDITPFGVRAAVRFADGDGRPVELHVDDRSRRRRRPARLLAPFGAAVEDPTCLLLAYLRRFDLVRRTGPEPRILIGGRPVRTGALPGGWLHRRRLVKYAADIVLVRLNEAQDGPVRTVDPAAPGDVELAGGTGIAAVSARHGSHRARLWLAPPLPDLAGLPDGAGAQGRWELAVDEMAIGGTWSARRRGDRADLDLDVTRGWRPAGLPVLMRVMTSVVRVFRSWPTTYRWSATVRLGARPAMTSRWERKAGERGGAYRRLTRSAVDA